MKLSRLRRGELLAGVAAAALIALLLGVSWFDRAGHLHSGWRALPGVRWLLLAAVAGALALAIAQAACSAPALPASLSVVATVLGFAATVALAIRLATTAATPRAGAWLGLAAVAALAAGSFLSLRDEAGWTPGPQRPIEVAELDRSR